MAASRRRGKQGEPQGGAVSSLPLFSARHHSRGALLIAFDIHFQHSRSRHVRSRSACRIRVLCAPIPGGSSKGKAAMATIIKEIQLKASPQKVWAALRDVGNIHNRLARGFVTETRLEGNERIVCFIN